MGQALRACPIHYYRRQCAAQPRKDLARAGEAAGDVL